jgi:hypothetical protein
MVISFLKCSSETRHNEPYSSNQNEIKEMEIDEELEQDIKLGAIQKHILPKDGMMSNPVSSAHNFLYNCLLFSDIHHYISYTHVWI